MKIEEIKKCPFCGHDASFILGTINACKYVGFLQCNYCGAQGEKFEDKSDEVVKLQCINSWNIRLRLP